MYCPKCGEEIAVGSRFCCKCGNVQRPGAPQQEGKIQVSRNKTTCPCLYLLPSKLPLGTPAEEGQQAPSAPSSRLSN